MEKFMRVYDDFINENEEQSMYDEVHPYLRRLRYEFDHWDDVSEHANNSLCLACIIEGHLFTWTHVNGYYDRPTVEEVDEDASQIWRYRSFMHR